MKTLPLNPSDFKWYYSGILHDVRTAIAGEANFLTALGLLVYTEVIGRDILEHQKTRKFGEEDAFYCFYEKYMHQTNGRSAKVYEHFRHGLAHGYSFKATDVSVGTMNPNPDCIPPETSPPIVISADGKTKEFVVNAYFRDFQKGLAKWAEENPTILSDQT